MIAQEVEQVIPDLVQENTEGIKVLHYQNLTAVLVEAIKEQQEQINTLKQTVQELSTKLENCCP
jgi:flagellar biosynthesis chaperone FliJ